MFKSSGMLCELGVEKLWIPIGQVIGGFHYMMFVEKMAWKNSKVLPYITL